MLFYSTSFFSRVFCYLVLFQGFERDLGELWNNRGSLEQLETSKVEEFEAKINKGSDELAAGESCPEAPYENPRRPRRGEI